MKRSNKTHSLLALAGFLGGAVAAQARTDYYTSDFYTRGTDAALYVDQGGIPDLYHLPVQNWSLLPRITLEATKADNYFLDDEKQSATIINLIPGAMMIYGRPDHNHVYADVGLILPVYKDDDAIDTDPSYMATVGGVYDTGRSQVHGRVGYRRTESTNTELGERVVGENVTFDIAAEHRVSLKTSLGLNGTFEDHAFDGDYVAYQRYYGAGRIYHRLTEKSEWFVQAGAGFDDVEDEVPGVTGDATFYDLSAGVRGKPSPKTSVFGRVGYRWRDYDDAEIESVDGIVANLGAKATPFGFSTFSAELLSDIRPDITGAGDSTQDSRLILGVQRRIFSERLHGDASLLFGEVKYNGPGGTTQDDYWGFRLALDWWTIWEASLGLSYAYTNRDSNERADYESGLWTLRMSWNY